MTTFCPLSDESEYSAVRTHRNGEGALVRYRTDIRIPAAAAIKHSSECLRLRRHSRANQIGGGLAQSASARSRHEGGGRDGAMQIDRRSACVPCPRVLPILFDGRGGRAVGIALLSGETMS
jgi:hypothetical protein